MARETIFVIDADQDLDQRITATLEAAGYSVFTAPSGVVNADILRKLAPSLIYLKPLAPSRSGFEPCKAIHDIPGLKNVPIVILASLKGPLDPRQFASYGIVDSLKPTFSPDELTEKTQITLGKTRLLRLSGQDEPIIEKPVNPSEEAGTATAEDDQPVPPKGSIEAMALQEHELTGLSWQREDAKEDQKERPTRTAPWSQAVGGKGGKRSPLPLVVGAAILLLIGGAVLVGYHPFTPARKVLPSPAVPAPSPVPSKPPDADSGPRLPQARNPAEASSPPSPPSQVEQVPSSSQNSAVRLPRKPFYSVQLGAFRNEGNALILRNKFREKGYDAFTQRGVTGDRSAIYRVLAGKYEDKKTAERLAGEIQFKEEIKTTLYKE